jgi:hypothetical protein
MPPQEMFGFNAITLGPTPVRGLLSTWLGQTGLDGVTPFTLHPSDFHLFGPSKDAIRGRHFEDDEQVIQTLKKWLREREPTGRARPCFALEEGHRTDGEHVEK